MKELRNFHLPLPDELYARLRAEAYKAKQPATWLAREAIDSWLRLRQRAATHTAIMAYAARHAGTGADLDPALESAAIDSLSPE
jgi:predicted transcriptional regulator